jgi:Flp pilus assembly protein TadD
LSTARLALCLVAAFCVGCGARQPQSAKALHDYFESTQKSKPPGDAPPATEATPAASLRLETIDPELAAARLQLTIAPTADHHRQVGEAYARLGVRDLAFDQFTAAVRLNHADAYAYDGLARIWRDWGLSELALSEAARAVYYAPTAAVTRNTLGTVLLKLGQPAAARTAFERARELDPSAGYVVSNLCFLDITGPPADDAIDTCTTAVQMRPRSRATRNNLALAFAAAGEFGQAEAEFAIAGDPATAAYNMGIAYMITHRFDDAAIQFQRARRARPGLVLATRRLEQIQTLRGR